MDARRRWEGFPPFRRPRRARRAGLSHLPGRGLRLEPLEDRRLLTAITVTDLSDTIAADGVVTLREAIHAANTDSPVNEAAAGDGADTITFDPSLFTPGPQTLTLAGVELAITDDLTITGPGADLLIIDANQLSRVFDVDDGSETQIHVSLSELTMTRGKVLGADGAGISNKESLRIDGCVVSDCEGVRVDVNILGGGIWSTGPLEIYDSTITGNYSRRTPGPVLLFAGRPNPTLRRATSSERTRRAPKPSATGPTACSSRTVRAPTRSAATRRRRT